MSFGCTADTSLLELATLANKGTDDKNISKSNKK